MATVLSLVGTGAGGQILMALGKGPLRTGQLIERIDGFSPRSVYRYAAKLEENGLIDRFEEADAVPSTVVLSLSDPSGRNLCRLLASFVPMASSDGRGPKPWACLSLLGELWQTGFLEELSYGPRSLTDLARVTPEMSFHQVNRRMKLFVDAGLLTRRGKGHLVHYELTVPGRRYMALIAAIGRWRHRHVDADGVPGLTLAEMATVLRAALPLTALPGHAGTRLGLVISEAVEGGGHRQTEVLRAKVDRHATVRYEEEAGQECDGSAAATLNTWFAAVLDGNRGRIRVRGDLSLVDAFLTQLYEALWESDDRPRPAAG